MSAPDPRLLEELAGIVKAKGEVPRDLDPFAFCMKILPLLGTTDGRLREWRVYGIIALWVTRRTMSDDQLRTLLWTIADREHLFLGIGEDGTDSVYMRAFAVLVLAPFVRTHRERPYLSNCEVGRLTETVIRYLDGERDLRGFVSDETFWAHAVAHAADTLGELAQCEEVGTDALRAILACLGRSIVTGRTVWRHEEDARAAAAAIRALKRGRLSDAQVREWVDGLVPEARFEGTLPGVHWRYVNARNFLRCLIYQAQTEGLAATLVDLVRVAHDRLPER
jgi:hypothetical protein